MKFLSICSGIEAASVASSPLGWECVGVSEIEPFPCALLAHHYPSVPNFGDMTKYAEWPEQLFIEADAIVGGPPCQAFSVAGQRAGLEDARGNLTLIYASLIDHADRIRRSHGKPPVWCLYENVPGLLSDRTNAFGCLLGKLAGEDVPLLPPGGKWTDAGAVLGHQRTIAWRILDAQYFGLAQRRRRVFVVASAGTVNPCEILFESEGVRRDSPPRREARKEDTGTSADGARTGGGIGVDCYNCSVTGDVAATFGANSGGTNNAGPKVIQDLVVRRLTPTECERLQGFPDGYTAIPWKKKPAEECPDSLRYKSLGNSWSVPCAKWIFSKIKNN